MNPKCASCRRPADRPCPAVDWIWPEVAPHPRFCANMASDPESWAPIIEDRASIPRPEVRATVVRPMPSITALESVDQSLAVLPMCPHRTGRWSCCETIVYCALEKGQAGIIDRSDCAGCTDRPITLGILSPGCNTGGAEHWMLGLIARLDPARVVTAGVAIAYEQHIDPAMLAALESLCPAKVGIAAVDALWASCDVVLVWGVPGWDQRMPARPRHAKAVLVSHGVGSWTAPVFLGPARADGWAAVSAAAVDPIPESHKGRSVVLANGIDLGRIEPSPGARDRIRAELGIAPSQRLALYLGRLSDEKNPRAFIDLAAECERRHPGRFAFAIVGDGQGRDKESAHASRHAPHVIFAGVQRNVGDWLAAADHVVMPSHEEADSLTLLESMAAGVPVVSTRVGRLREAEYAALARVVEVNPSAATLADALNADATDPGVPARVASARSLARSRHSAEAMAGRWMDYLEGVTGGTKCSSTTDSARSTTGLAVPASSPGTAAATSA